MVYYLVVHPTNRKWVSSSQLCLWTRPPLIPLKSPGLWAPLTIRGMSHQVLFYHTKNPSHHPCLTGIFHGNFHQLDSKLRSCSHRQIEKIGSARFSLKSQHGEFFSANFAGMMILKVVTIFPDANHGAGIFANIYPKNGPVM